MKVVLFIFLILSFNSLASDIDIAQVAQNLERSMETFEKECVNEDGSINNDKIMPSTLVSCADEQVFIQNQADLFERNFDENEINGDLSNCTPVVEEEEIGFLTGLISNTTKKVTCKDRESFKQSEDCTKNWMCNGLRSILNLDKLLPEMIRKPVRSYVADKGESIAPNCLAEGQPDCISELVTSLIGSLVETGKAIWNMLGATIDTLFSPSTWFDSASDKLHAASQASYDTVKKFIRNPGKWLVDFFSNIYNSTNKWIKSSVLCQKWSGTPHMSTCEEPLQSYDCLDCEDKVNGICSAVGVIASEVGVMVLTAGTGTVASVGAKVGAKVFSEVSKKAALKIKQKTPKLAGNIMARVDNKYVKGTVKYTAGAVKKTHKALLTSINAFRARAQKMKETKTVAAVTKATKKVADTLADPSGLATKVAKGTILRTALVLRKSENKDIKKFADDEVQLAKAARDNGGDDKKAFKDRAQVRPMRTTVNIAESKFKNNPHHSGGNHGNDHSEVVSTSGGNHGGNDHTNPKIEHPEKPSKNTELAETNPKKDSHSGPNDDDNDGEANQVPVPTPRGFAGNAFQLAAHVLDDYMGPDLTGRKKMPTTKKAVVGVAVAADMGMKVSGGAEEFDKAQEAQEQEYANSSRGFDNPLAKMGAHGIRKSNLNAAKNITAKKDINSDDDLKEVLGLSSENSTQQMRDQAQAKVAQLANVYSEENRQNMVSAITNSERGITAEQANHIFNERQQQVIAAKKYMTNVKAQDASPQRNVVSHNRPAPKVHSNINQYKGAIDSYFAGKKAGQAENETTRVLEDEIKALKEELKSPVKVTTKETKNAPSMVAPNVSPKGNVKVATRAPASVTSRPATNSGVSAQAPSSFFSSTPSISQVEEEENFDHLRTLHPDVIAKNESKKNKDEAKAENIERKPASFSYKDFVAGATGEQSTPKKVNTLQSVAVDLKEIDFSQTEKDHATKFKKLLKEYRVATLVEHYELNGKQYIVYRFLNGESFGAIKRKNGGQTLINQSELASVIGL